MTRLREPHKTWSARNLDSHRGGEPATLDRSPIGAAQRANMALRRRFDGAQARRSGENDKAAIATAVERGAKKFLTKPVDFPQLKLDIAAVIADARS